MFFLHTVHAFELIFLTAVIFYCISFCGARVCDKCSSVLSSNDSLIQLNSVEVFSQFFVCVPSTDRLCILLQYIHYQGISYHGLAYLYSVWLICMFSEKVIWFNFLKIKSSLYSRYYVKACNDWRGPTTRLSVWATQLRRNVAAVASRQRHCPI